MNEQLPLKTKKRYRIEELRKSVQDLEILQLAKMFAEEVDLEEYIDEETLILSCIKCRNDLERKNVNAFIAYDNYDPIGFLVGIASPCFHRPGIVAEQKLWYVVPQRRATVAPILLVRAYEKWARLNGATQIYTGSANAPLSEKTSKLLEHLNYRKVGAIHVKEI